MTNDISKFDDTIDVRDVIARFEDLEGAYEPHEEDEFALLGRLLEDLKGNGGDEEWRGDWYPITLIRDSYFKDYAMELAVSIDAINNDVMWPNDCIDWDKAARELRYDYSTIEFDGVEYWYR